MGGFMIIVSLLPFLHGIYLLVSCVSGGNSFPKPLSREEEEHYIRLYRENNDNEAKNKLVEHNLRLVAHVAKKYNGSGQRIDDLISIGTIGLIKGINSYNNDKGTKLATYVARCVENEILMSIRAGKKASNEIFIEETIGSDKDGNKMTFVDILSSDTDDVLDEVSVKLQMQKVYEEMEKRLTPIEKSVVMMRFGLKNTDRLAQRDIAKILGISRSYVSRLESKALGKLKKFFRDC